MNVFTNKKFGVILVVWACLLLFGLGMEVSEANALHTAAAADCTDLCIADCEDSGGCVGALERRCGSCEWSCGDGSTGGTTCT